MPIQLPPDQTIIRNARLTAIAALGELSRGHLKNAKDQVKKAMAGKKAEYAQSHLAQARLMNSNRSFVNAGKLHKLVIDKTVALKDFLACCSINKEQLKNHLSGKQIEELCDPAAGGTSQDGEAAGSLWVEFKPGIHIDLDQLEKAIEDNVKQQLEEQIPQPAGRNRELSERAR
jgi:hypothetical protein